MRSTYLIAAMGVITLITVESLHVQLGKAAAEKRKQAEIKRRIEAKELLEARAVAAMTSVDSNAIAAAQTPEEKARVLNREAIKQHKAGRFKEALKLYREAVTVQAQNPAIHNNLALLLKDMDLLPEAEREAETAISLNPKNANYYFNLGLILQKQQKFGNAISKLTRATRLNWNDPEAHFVLAQAFFDSGLPRSAESSIREALALRGSDPRYHRLLADALMRLNKANEALSEYNKTISLSPRAAGVRVVENKIHYLKQILSETDNKAATN